ncbi:MAG: hypothetical protein JWL90_1388 [Chthoniobacteraceae bacterium]|nr:hypothetical protein [Chthoniobacteraceae bacterium]
MRYYTKNRLLQWLRPASMMAVFAACLNTLAAREQLLPAEDSDAIHWNIVGECQMIVLGQKAALKLIPGLNDPAKIEGAYSQLEAMIEKDEAQLAAYLLVKTFESEKAETEETEEIRFPVNFEVTRLPTELGKLSPEQLLEVIKALPRALLAPTQFEMRKVGVMFELAAAVRANGSWLSVEVAAKHVRLPQVLKYDAGLLASGEHLEVEQPQFSVIASNSSMPVVNGQRILIGFHKLTEPAATYELFLLRVTATKVK